MQLQHELHIGLDLKYEIVLNVNIEDGLTNGASCTVKCVQVPPDKKTRGVIWMQFEDNDIGKNMRALGRNKYKPGIDPSWTPIVPETRKFTVGRNNEVARTQFPLRPASAKGAQISRRHSIRNCYRFHWTNTDRHSLCGHEPSTGILKVAFT